MKVIRMTDAHIYLRDVSEGRPVLTTDKLKAMRFDTLEDAALVTKSLGLTDPWYTQKLVIENE